MERLHTFTDKDLYIIMFSVYHEICKSAKSSALLHTSTMKKENNPFHFEQVVKQSNEAIKRLTELLPKTDTRREQYKLLDEKTLIKEAEEFFATEIY